MRRELILQLKKGRLDPEYFSAKYGVDVVQHFAPQWASLRTDGYLAQADAREVRLTREGYGRVDSLLPRFFLPEHTNIRYT
jgi:oxygen-independent coproporphyrinogen-3 oxidase